ncbi:MAG: hypothetical protein M5U28_43085 [Sandaracinaceae bacterium]|nr:hypothetical protein [Sandaracinaceae bacterium]
MRLDGERLDPLTGHEDLVVDLAVSPRGEVATASLDGTVRLFDARGSGRVIEQHEATSSAVAFSPDGARLATGDGHGVVRVRDARTGEQRGSFPIARARIDRVTWSDDGRSLVIVGDGRVRVIDADTGALRRMETAPSAHGAWLAPGGARLVYADGRRLVRTALELPLARDAASLLRWAEGRAGPGLTE